MNSTDIVNPKRSKWASALYKQPKKGLTFGICMENACKKLYVDDLAVGMNRRRTEYTCHGSFKKAPMQHCGKHKKDFF